ncbi:MAG: hypothetical protein JRI59_03290 [Deltaproteobacteria bacterium]|nr:hypothetical protein [Deltaproteobacteria bacterium]
MGPGVQHNLGEVAAMMKDLHILMSEGPLTPKLASRHEQGLKAMRRRVKEIRAMMKTH